MFTEKKIDSPSFLEKCYIHWKTRNYGRKIEKISLLVAVAIYMNKKVYEEELQSAKNYFLTLLKDEEDVENIMDYIKMKLSIYKENEDIWQKDRKKALDMVVKDEELYTHMIDIFHSDKSFDESEKLFEETVKRLI